MPDIAQWRLCNGSCCRVSPLRKVMRSDGQDCYFRSPDTPERGCTAMANSKRLNEMTEKEQLCFEEACLNWPQNVTPETQGAFGDCCWKWNNG